MHKTLNQLSQSLYVEFSGLVYNFDFIKAWKELDYSVWMLFDNWRELKCSKNSPKAGNYLLVEASIGFGEYLCLINKLIPILESGSLKFHPKQIHHLGRILYDLIFQKTIRYSQFIETSGCGFTLGFDDASDKSLITWDHFNIPQYVIYFMVNEFIVEGKIYSFSQFLRLWYELAKTHGVLSKENTILSCRDKEKQIGLNFDKRYIDENIILFDSNYNEISRKATFPKFLLGSKKNRKYTWIPWKRNKKGVFVGLWDEEYNKIGNW